MRRAALLLAASVSLTLPAYAGHPPEKVLLQDLVAQGVDAAQAAALSSAACHALGARRDLELLCGDDLRALMQWNAVATSLDACKDEACVSAGARGLDAKLVVSGSVSKVGDGFVLAMSLLDAKAGRVRSRAEVKAASMEALHQQVAEAISQLFARPKGP